LDIVSTYDALGRKADVRWSDGTYKSRYNYRFDDAGRMEESYETLYMRETGTIDKISRYVLAGDGSVAKVIEKIWDNPDLYADPTDEANYKLFTLEYEYNKSMLGNMTHSFEAMSEQDMSRQSDRDYRADGLLKSVKDSTGAIVRYSYEYTDQGRLLKSFETVSDYKSRTPAGPSEERFERVSVMEYDILGNITKEWVQGVYPPGEEIMTRYVYNYDSQGSVITVSEVEVAPSNRTLPLMDTGFNLSDLLGPTQQQIDEYTIEYAAWEETRQEILEYDMRGQQLIDDFQAMIDNYEGVCKFRPTSAHPPFAPKRHRCSQYPRGY